MASLTAILETTKSSVALAFWANNNKVVSSNAEDGDSIDRLSASKEKSTKFTSWNLESRNLI